jgi:signal transduction histidine kinase
VKFSWSIRRKLFLGFIAAAAVPLCCFVAVARTYLGSMRADADQRFAESASAAFHEIDERATNRYWTLVHFAQRMLRDGQAGAEISDDLMMSSVLAAGQSQPPAVLFKDALRRLRADFPEVIGAKVVVDGHPVYSDLRVDLPSLDGISTFIGSLDHLGIGTAFPFNSQHKRHFIGMWLSEGDSWWAVEIDPRALLHAKTVFRSGWAFYLERDGQLRHGASEATRLRENLPLDAIVKQLPGNGERVRVNARGKAWLVYAGVSADRANYELGSDARLLVAVPEHEVYGSVIALRDGMYGAIVVSVLMALWLAQFLSGRFVGAVENLKRGVDALERGEFAHLDKASSDELGGELVERVNRMATTLAERKRRAEVESWQRLVRVLSHEINNTLGPVKSVAATVRDQIAPRLADGETAEDLQTAFRLIGDRVDSLSAFIAAYAELAKLPEPARAPTDFNQLVRGAVEMLAEPAAARHVAVAQHYDQAARSANLDRAQLERVAINLVKNAVEAAAGHVWVSTALRGGGVELTVEDDGPGIAAEARPHLFVPYFTTKPGGSGIGLALARQIVLGHGGNITTEDRPGGGTIVRVRVPVSGGLV